MIGNYERDQPMGSMLRLIDGVFYEGKPSDEFELSVHRLGNGHAEASVRRMVWWSEIGPASADELEVWRRDLAESEEERREANRGRAARRATTKVRRLVKAAGMDALLTLTYRVLQTDLALCKKHLKEFVRRMRRLIPGWQYIAAFERQERGCWHVHMAIHKLPMNLPASNGVKVKSYNIVRAVWRSVVGQDNGNIDQSRRKAFSRRSSAKLASYLSKYMLKAFQDGDDWANRYSSGGLGALPQPERVRFQSERFADLVALAYEEVAMHACEIWTSLRRSWSGIAFDGPPETFWISTGPEGLQMEVHHG
ncbi:rolling circle replication-associated protein [Paucibacter sp. XJ19-41]|uniref:rolling circle replication-associated protein n=1 Tax=Paucibacter sp. XJ19-41 TaxID=2927824 RepID=UPI00234A0976|nr:hypothetical protein [Paucibacter sp. XJ19-41]MDC6168336.1 hypothetical protein [Paucibacter sp. XJ19-41]